MSQFFCLCLFSYIAVILGSTQAPRLSAEIADRILIARLSLSSEIMTDDPEIVTVLASLPEDLTIFEYLLACWKRVLLERSSLSMKKVCS